jgi:uncharacterized spore protein YtfJ
LAVGGTGEGDANHHRSRRGKGTGGASAGGGKVRPVAVFSDQGVEVLPIDDRQSSLEKLMEKIPDLVGRFGKCRCKEDEACEACCE